MNSQETEEVCIFCNIVAGVVPAVKVYEDEHTLAFLNIAPNNLGHALVIPKDHFENVYTTPAETWCRVMLVAQKVSIAMRNGLDADGINIIMNNEGAAGQVVFHDHIHVIPRFERDEYKPTETKVYKDSEEMELFAEKIRKEIVG